MAKDGSRSMADRGNAFDRMWLEYILLRVGRKFPQGLYSSIPQKQEGLVSEQYQNLSGNSQVKAIWGTLMSRQFGTENN